MSKVGQPERVTQNRVIKFFEQQLGYQYLGDWKVRDNANIDKPMLSAWLSRQGVSDTLIAKALHELTKATAMGSGRNLFEANRDFYNLLRYGIKEKEGAGQNNQTIWLIDWETIENNDFAIAEEVTVKGENTKRPDLVLYINGMALGVLELKRSITYVSEGIRQNLDNQKQVFIQQFFTTMQLVMAGNDSEGLRYGTIKTPEKYYLEWKEQAADTAYSHLLDQHLYQVCRKERLLELIHDFIVFDHGVKKICRHNQYFGVKAAQQHVARHEGGIIWHTQGSGKSLTMVWLAKWIRSNMADSRILVITDRTELDEQIEKVFSGVSETIYRTKNGTDLIATLNAKEEWLICSLVHKFGQHSEKVSDQAMDQYIAELRHGLTKDFKAKGQIFVFVDECHRTQSGKLHDAMKLFLPEAVFIGFTGTPLLKKDKKTSLEVFGTYIHTYKFNEAVADKVILDLRYEARDIDQYINSPEKIDKWFEAKTKDLTDYGKTLLKRRWGSLQKIHSSEPRLKQIANDIVFDMTDRQRLSNDRGNALLVCSSVYQACVIYDIFSKTELMGKCAVVTSYQPTTTSIKGEETGEGQTEALLKYDVYRRMIADYMDVSVQQAANQVEAFEQKVKKDFIESPGQMKLLIVVDKLLTGFDAPPATYLYIDKQMQDHGLFQAICRVNRLDGEDKDYGYIIDYRDLFKSLDKAIIDYTSEAFENYNKADVEGLIKNRLIEGKRDLDDALEDIRALCEPVAMPKSETNYLHYFMGVSGSNESELDSKKILRVTLYKQVSKLVRAYINLAGEMQRVGFNTEQSAAIKDEVEHYEKVKKMVQQGSGDYVDMKLYEPAMRRLLDMYISADETEEVAKFDELGLVELILNKENGLETVLKAMGGNQEAMSEAIENNIRRKIIDENPVNPKYYEKMSVLLDELIELRRNNAIEYKQYLEEIKRLAMQTFKPEGQAGNNYPLTMNTLAKRALYDNLDKDEALASQIDTAILQTKKEGWLGNRIKERQIERAIKRALGDLPFSVEAIFEIVKAQREYH